MISSRAKGFHRNTFPSITTTTIKNIFSCIFLDNSRFSKCRNLICSNDRKQRNSQNVWKKNGEQQKNIWDNLRGIDEKKTILDIKKKNTKEKPENAKEKNVVYPSFYSRTMDWHEFCPRFFFSIIFDTDEILGLSMIENAFSFFYPFEVFSFTAQYNSIKTKKRMKRKKQANEDTNRPFFCFFFYVWQFIRCVHWMEPIESIIGFVLHW